jgi:pimeloyl-ACP methyl ester carboxylesterase
VRVAANELRRGSDPGLIAVPLVAGTAVRGIAATILMRGVLQRHPNAFLITLKQWGLTIPLPRSQHHIERDIAAGLAKQGRPADSPVVLVGHSQGGLAVLRYAIDHQDQVAHAISVGAPWSGTRAATFSSGLYRRTGINLTPALTDMAPDSEFLNQLHADLPAIGSRVTNIYSHHEVLIQPYFNAHIAVPGVTNILIASEREVHGHLLMHPDLPVDDFIYGRITHAGEMNSPEVRAIIWAKVGEVAQALGMTGG